MHRSYCSQQTELERRLLWACNVGEFGDDFLVCDTYFLCRSDVLGFARRHGLEPPSWWQSERDGIDSINTHSGLIKETLLAGKLDKEAVRTIVKNRIRYNFETFEQAWQQIPDALKHCGRPRKKPS
jgi:hypothetical protein